jgi:L-lysine exporter family protein LysE/ArgO
VAIGAQNAFVLRQGLRREHVPALVALCAFSDALLIVAGIAGLGVLFDRYPFLLTLARWGGAAFLLVYGGLAALRACRGSRLHLSSAPAISLRQTLLTGLALTWLNPHVYLDTVVLLGSVANQRPDDERFSFGTGAVLASLAWFTALGWGARLLVPWFERPLAWRVLDGLIAVVMLSLALGLALM